jgi:hypothetical protein
MVEDGAEGEGLTSVQMVWSVPDDPKPQKKIKPITQITSQQ